MTPKPESGAPRISGAEQVRDALMKPELEREWRELLSSWEGADQADRDKILERVKEYRQELLSVVETIDDLREVEFTLAIRYVELKSRWMLLNMHIQYGLSSRGVADEAAVYQASVLSFLLAATEPLLRDDDIDVINEFLSNPIERAVS